MHLKYPEIDPIREQYLKLKFADMTPSSLADYFKSHKQDPDFHEYMTRYATSQVNEMVLIILDTKRTYRKRKKIESIV